ncbi:MAG: TldD/PmbA family protein [Acidisphaera sp.]|nr:TldD/PmbA family protein [Acidisphaera sp.]MBV9811305.1 TldD/PmbA family protein [Acetobacteraceae bacterium]
MTDLEGLSALLASATKAGADAADALLVSHTSLSVQQRLRAVEHVERSESRDLGLRVFLGKRVAIVSSSTFDPSSFDRLAERAMAMARVVPEDPYAGLGDASAPADGADALDLCDATVADAERLRALAAAAEDAALAVHGVTNAEGAEAGYSRAEVSLMTTAGFVGSFARTGFSVSATALAGEGVGMQRDYDYSTAVHLADVADPATIGRTAAEKAVARLNPTRPKTGKLPIVFDPRVASSLVGHLAGAINGAAVARGTTFLKDKMGARLFASGVFVHDDPRRVRGLRSRPFDGEGVPGRPLALIDDGVLTTWLLDTHSARQLGLATTGHASRGTGGPPGPAPTNLFMAAGSVSPAELMADIREGVYVTEMIGMGVNGVTGDYSRGAAGYMIRDGALAEPVAELTIAGHLLEMFAHLTPADDLAFRYGVNAPTLRVDGMTLAGA